MGGYRKKALIFYENLMSRVKIFNALLRFFTYKEKYDNREENERYDNS